MTESPLLYAAVFISSLGSVVAILGLALVAFKLRKRLQRLEHRISDTMFWVHFDRTLRPLMPLPRPGGWAVATDFLAELVRLIRTRKPQFIVELGSGLSTLIAALALKEVGTGRLISFDHDDAFGRQTQARLRENGLQTIADVRTARLKQRAGSPQAGLWYDVTALADLRDIDMLVVDGPPADIHPEIRGAALTYFWERLAPGGIIVLDDANRKGERSFVQSEMKRLPGMAVEYIDTEKGMVVLTKCSETADVAQATGRLHA